MLFSVSVSGTVRQNMELKQSYLIPKNKTENNNSIMKTQLKHFRFLWKLWFSIPEAMQPVLAGKREVVSTDNEKHQ